MQAKDAPNPVAAPSGWARVRVNVKKDKTSKASSRQLTGHAMTMRRNLLHKDPLPEEASEAYTMLIDSTTSNLGHAHRQRKEAKGVLCKALWMSQNEAVASICRVHVSSICRVQVSYTLYNFKNLVAQQLRKYTRHSPWQAARVTCAEQQHACARSQHKKEQRGALWYMQTEGITRRS
jgi:hypothetical protein